MPKAGGCAPICSRPRATTAGAMISLQRAVVLNPRQFAAMTELAEMLEDYGDKPSALKLYRRVLVLDPQMKVATERAKALAKEVEGQGI